MWMLSRNLAASVATIKQPLTNILADDTNLHSPQNIQSLNGYESDRICSESQSVQTETLSPLVADKLMIFISGLTCFA